MDCLEKRGWDNCGLCPLYKKTLEPTNHLFVHFRFYLCLWTLIKEWLVIPNLSPNLWQGRPIKLWLSSLMDGATPNLKAITSLSFLVSSRIWNERNARVFCNKHAPPFMILEHIKRKARLWVLAGAKHLGDLLPGE
jgi:hypothetical protein